MDPDQPFKRSLFKKLQQKLAKLRFAAFSILLHAILVVVAFTIAVVKIVNDTHEFTNRGGPLDGGSEVSAPEPPENVQHEVGADPQPIPSLAMPSNAITTMTLSPTKFTFAKQSPISPATASLDKVRNLTEMANKPGPSLRPGVHGDLRGRDNGTSRMQAMKERGGKERTEKAVLAGLRWLKEHQNGDGSWGEAERSAMTGLAMLAFLGHGELPEAPEFGPTVRRGLEWMIQLGTKYQGRFSGNQAFSANASVYAHGIATYALGEYFALTKDESVQGILQQAVGYIVEGQNPGGGWDYAYKKGVRQDLSVAGWQIQALKAAHLTGLDLPGVDTSLDRAMLFIKQWQGDGGGFGYDSPASRYGLTGVGVLSTVMWKGKENEVAKEGVQYIIDQAEGKERVKYREKTANLYAWYYHTQACLMFGGPAWTRWNRMFQDEVVEAQSPDGSWPVTGGKGHGPESSADGDGPTYRTALCALMLESYYRYLPASR